MPNCGQGLLRESCGPLCSND